MGIFVDKLPSAINPMARRNRELSPDPQGRYRPYLGWKLGEDGERRQHRFSLGTDKGEAEKRLARIRELYDDNCRFIEENLWSPLALSFAEELARGKRQVAYSLPDPDECVFDPLTDYAQVIQVERDRFPPLGIVPSEPHLYAGTVTARWRPRSGSWRSRRLDSPRMAGAGLTVHPARSHSLGGS